jgi:uncharacterized protein YfaS (alpha-2-macroglobulin family)
MQILIKASPFKAVAACAILLVFASTVCAQRVVVGKRKPGTFDVVVAEDQSGHPIPGARVFILSANGKVLSEGITDANGDVTIRKPTESEGPAFLLAEKAWYFIGGVKWDPGFDERLIHLAPLAVM